MIDQKAKAVFDTLCGMLDAHNLRYETIDRDFAVRFQAHGEDIPLDIYLEVNAERNLILLLSHLPFAVAEDKRTELAVAISVINNNLIDGCFDYDLSDGTIIFRMTNSYLESEVSQELFEYMLFLSFATVDEYNDKLMMLSKGVISLAQFLESK